MSKVVNIFFQHYMGTATYNNKRKRLISGNTHLYLHEYPDIYRTTQRFRHNLVMSLITIPETSSYGEPDATETRDDATRNAGLAWLGYLRTWSHLADIGGKAQTDLWIGAG